MIFWPLYSCNEIRKTRNERLKSFVKIWTVSEFNANFLTFWGLYYIIPFCSRNYIGFSYIVIWWLIFEKKPFQFWQKIWIWVIDILLQLYQHQLLINWHSIPSCAHIPFSNNVFCELMLKNWPNTLNQNCQKMLYSKAYKFTSTLFLALEPKWLLCQLSKP